MAKANSIISSSIVNDNIIFNVAGVGTLTLNMEALSPEVKRQALYDRFINRVIDAGAIPCDTETGKPASPEQKYDALKAIVEHYNSGSVEWNIGRSGNRGGSSGGFVLQAIALVQGLPVDNMRKALQAKAEAKGLTLAQVLNRFAKAKDIQEKVAELMAEKASQSSINSDDILADMV